MYSDSSFLRSLIFLILFSSVKILLTPLYHGKNRFTSLAFPFSLLLSLLLCVCHFPHILLAHELYTYIVCIRWSLQDLLLPINSLSASSISPPTSVVIMFSLLTLHTSNTDINSCYNFIVLSFIVSRSFFCPSLFISFYMLLLLLLQSSPAHDKTSHTFVLVFDLDDCDLWVILPNKLLKLYSAQLLLISFFPSFLCLSPFLHHHAFAWPLFTTLLTVTLWLLVLVSSSPVSSSTSSAVFALSLQYHHNSLLILLVISNKKYVKIKLTTKSHST